MITLDTSIEGSVISAVASTCRIERSEIGRELTFQQLGVDSMTLTSIISRLEAECEHEFTSEQIVALLQAEALRDFILLVAGMVTLPPRAAD